MTELSIEIAEKNTKRWRRPAFLAASAVLAITVVVLAHDVMLPLVLGLLIAYVLSPLVSWVEKRKVQRGLAVLLVYVFVLGTLGTFIRFISPRIGHELRSFGREVPVLTAKVNQTWIPAIQGRIYRKMTGIAPAPAPEPGPPQPALLVRPQLDGSFAVDVGSGVAVRHNRDGFIIDKPHERRDALDGSRFIAEAMQSSVSYAQQNALELARIGSGIIAGVSRFIFIFGLTLMVAAYLMITRERTLNFFISLARPSTRDDFHRLLWRVDRGLAGVVRGQLIICLINGALSAIGFAFVGLKYWPVLVIIATLFSLVPIFGSIASAVPAVALGLTQSAGTGLFVLLWIIGIHQLEANLLNPKIMGDAAKIHPILVIFSLLVGEHFFGIPGALLAVPCMSITQSLFIHFRQIVQESDPEFAYEPGPTLPPAR